MNNQNTIKPGMTLDMKARLFAQYWGQDAFRHHLSKYNGVIDIYRLSDRNVNQDYSFLELTPLSDITDEDAIEVAKLQGYESDCYRHMDLHFDITDPNILECCFYSATTDMYEVLGSGVTDYLRSKGYALPWMGLSVEDMVQAGWIKLKVGK